MAGINVLAHILYLINFIYLIKLNNKNQKETERVYREIREVDEKLRDMGVETERLPEPGRITNTINVIGIIVCGLLLITNLFIVFYYA